MTGNQKAQVMTLKVFTGSLNNPLEYNTASDDVLNDDERDEVGLSNMGYNC